MGKLYGYTDPETGRYTISDERPPARLCDFCGIEEIHHLYATRDARMPDPAPGLPVLMAIEGWTACKSCTDLIEGEAWEKLTDRALDEFLRRSPEAGNDPYRKQIRAYIRSVHETFRHSRQAIT